ncbi:hypothetical protein CHRYSEOSP005_09400 [Chryseobacterium sp. Alg-005]
MNAFAQIPTGYYNGTTGLTGYALKTKLSEIISNGHSDQGYNGLWTGYQTTDRDYYYENNGKVLDMYSENPNGVDPYEYTIISDQCGNYSAEGACYNREHTVPQSLFNSASPMKNDIHFIPPTDGKVNGMRSDYPYGVVTNPTWTSQNGSKLGPNTTPGYSGTAFEPINAFKGDIARMIFYFVTRYQNQVPGFTSGNMLDGTTTRSLTQWELEVLLAWHDADPVSQREIDRNNNAYAFQGNRNPYIDHPAWVHDVWGYVNTTPDTTPPTTPLNLAASNITGGSATITWTASTDNIAVTGYNVYINGVLYGSSGTNSINVYGLNPNTTYQVTVVATDAAGNVSPASAPFNFTTTNTPPAGGSSSELYISEYVEGSSNNKALELTNATPDPIDLSNYSIKKQANGGGSWVNEAILTGTLQPSSAFVITHSGAAFTCSFTSNLTLGGAPIDFNGNDPVGLFKNGVLIDIVGTFNGGSADFAADVTLRRNVSNPSTTFSLSQWNSFPQNTCDNLGIINPNSVLGTHEIQKTSGFTIYPNPVKNNELYVKGENLTTISRAEIYDMSGALIQVITHPFKTSDKITLRNIIKGNYILKAGNTTAKFIVE